MYWRLHTRVLSEQCFRSKIHKRPLLMTLFPSVTGRWMDFKFWGQSKNKNWTGDYRPPGWFPIRPGNDVDL